MSAAPSRSSGATSSPTRRWLPWIAVAVVVVALLAFGTFGQSEPSDAQRAQDLAETIRCPVCKSQAVASSDAASSLAVKALIRERIAEGDSDEQIRDYVASRYGREVLLDPASSGIGALVWALPVVLVVVALFGLAVRFRDYRPGARAATDEDRRLVDAALGAAGDPVPTDGEDRA